MTRRIVRQLHLLLATLLAGFLVSCGTAHQFMPPQPMERGQWQIQTYWHYDFGSKHPIVTSVIPSLNFYTGLGERFNFGFAAGPLLFLPSNVNLSRGYQSGDDRFWTHYLAYTPPISGTVNPIWETGITYSIIEDDFAHSLTAAIGYGQYTAWENKSLALSGWGKRSNPLVPALKYTFTGVDAALSWSNYLGNTRSWMKPFVVDVLRHNDTILLYPPGSIAEIATPVDYSFHFASRSIEIRKSDGSVDTLHQQERFIGCIMPIVAFGMNDFLSAWIGDRYREYSYKGTTIILDPADLQRRAVAGEAIVIRRFPDELVARVKGLSPWTTDHSFGIAVLAHPEKSSEE